MTSSPDILLIPDLCKAPRIGRTKAYELVRSGQIKSIRVGNSIRIPKTFLLDYISRMEYTGNETGRHRHFEGGEDESNG